MPVAARIALCLVLVLSGCGWKLFSGRVHSLLITDFDSTDLRLLELRDACPYEPRGSLRFAVARCDTTEFCLQIDYSFDDAESGEIGVALELGSDLSRYDRLRMRARSDPGTAGSGVRIGFRKAGTGEGEPVEVGSTVVRIEEEWREIDVPLGRMTGIGDWSLVADFFISFHPRRSATPQGRIWIDDIVLVDTGVRTARASDPLIPERKRKLERSLGGPEAVRSHLAARLTGWPSTLHPRKLMPTDNRQFLLELARDTWEGVDALTDREHALPIDHVRFFGDSTDPRETKIGDYTSPTNIGLHLIAIVAAHKLGMVSHDGALERVRRVLDTLEILETFHGFFFNFYDTTTLERSSHFVSFVDSSWLTAGLIVLRNAFPEVARRCSALIDRSHYGLFYDHAARLMSHGFYVNVGSPSEYHYGLLYVESRLGALIAIGKGDVTAGLWHTMLRTLPASCAWQSRMPVQCPFRETDRVNRCYEWKGIHFVPSWGGSMFEALMPTLVLDELKLVPDWLGRNNQAHVAVQQLYARDHGLDVWGFSPCYDPASPDYGEYGVPVLGTRGYSLGPVTPHAAALALAVAPQEAIANLRRLYDSYEGIYGEYGFYDAVDPRSGEVARAYLSLDQSMIFIALANHLAKGAVQDWFANDPIVRAALHQLFP